MGWAAGGGAAPGLSDGVSGAARILPEARAYHRDTLAKCSAKSPSARPVIRPIATKTGAMSQAASPNATYLAMTICTRLDEIAPKTETPI